MYLYIKNHKKMIGKLNENKKGIGLYWIEKIKQLTHN